MTAFAVTVLGARPAVQTAAPAIVFQLRVEDIGAGRVHAIVLRCQTRIDPRRRRYTPEEQARLYELFGQPSQWERTLQAVTWAHSTLVVPSFEQRIDIDLPIACTYDMEVGSSKYLHAVRDGEIPLVFLFSGTIFRAGGAGEAGLAPFVVEPVSWDMEASYRMPATTWQAAMDQFFPGGGWVRLQRDTLDRLQAFRGRQAVTTWDETIDALLQLAASEQAV
jgi:hypothetical protein